MSGEYKIELDPEVTIVSISGVDEDFDDELPETLPYPPCHDE